MTLLRSLATLALLAGCGAPAIVDASRTLAAARGCDAAELTLTESSGGYAVSGCGADGFFACAAGACTEAAGQADTAWIDEARPALAEIADEVLACNDGEAFTLQLRIDRDGQPQGVASHPALDGEERVCVGRLVLDHVALDAFEGERLIAYRYGEAAAPPPEAIEPADPVVEEPVEPAAEEPAEEAPPAEDTGVSDALIE